MQIRVACNQITMIKLDQTRYLVYLRPNLNVNGLNRTERIDGTAQVVQDETMFAPVDIAMFMVSIWKFSY